MSGIEMMKNIMLILKITSMCFSVKTRSCLLKITERSRKYSLHQLSTKLRIKSASKLYRFVAGSNITFCCLADNTTSCKKEKKKISWISKDKC